jgi:hypothetical protein
VSYHCAQRRYLSAVCGYFSHSRAAAPWHCNPDIAARIEAAIRQNSGLIAEQILAADGGGEEAEE